MSRYSFLLASEEPKYFELTPSIRLRKYGGWLVAESIEQEEISRQQSQSTIKAVQLAKKIASTKGIALDEAFELLQNSSGSEAELLSEFTEETLSMMNSGASAEQSNAKLITTFIRCRGEGLVDGEWTRLSDWCLDDTKTMTRQQISKALEFIADEQDEEVKAAQAKKSKKKTEVEQEQSA